MTRKVCKRKHWSTAPGFNPVAHAIAGACITDSKALADLLTRELSSLEAMTHGRAGLQEWHDLSGVLNLCEQAALTGIGPEALQSCKTAQDALIEAAYRYESTQRMGLSGAGIQAMRDVIEYHDLQRRSIPRSQYEQIIRAAGNRVRSKNSRGGRDMKQESIAGLLESGEIVKTDDVIYMIDTITSMIDKGMESDSGAFIGLAMELMANWRESLEQSDTTLADEAIANIVMGKQ